MIRAGTLLRITPWPLHSPCCFVFTHTLNVSRFAALHDSNPPSHGPFYLTRTTAHPPPPRALPPSGLSGFQPLQSASSLASLRLLATWTSDWAKEPTHSTAHCSLSTARCPHTAPHLHSAIHRIASHRDGKVTRLTSFHTSTRTTCDSLDANFHSQRSFCLYFDD